MPGDDVFIPELRVKGESAAVNKRHRFKRKGVPASFTLTLLRLGLPRKNVRYVLYVDQQFQAEGVTDAKGKLTEGIPPNARTGRLLLSECNEEIDLQFGGVDPIDEISGLQVRLRNLGLYTGRITGEMTAETELALARFQRIQNLEASGASEDEIRRLLVQMHGS
jgi:N-acetylmuramoyl-L-alanine amidase